MKRCGSDFETESNQSHDETSGEQRLTDSTRARADRGETVVPRAVDKTQAEQGERAGGAAEKKIFQAGLGGMESVLSKPVIT